MSDRNAHEADTVDIESAWGNLMAAAGARKTKGATVQQRREAEKPPVAVGDGRRLRATGRTKQLGVKVKPEFYDELFSLSQDRGVGMAAMLETIFAEWKQSGKGRGK